jgi:catechol 2,3-dioxygenase-like lactoylglutathione lyase family enzyme
MSESTPVPNVDCEQVTAGVAVADIAKAVEFYTTKLGFKLGFTWGDPPGFAGVNFGDVQIFLQKESARAKSDAVSAFFMVNDADGLYQFHRTSGVEIPEPIGNREYGIRDYTVRDQDGNLLVFGQPLYTGGDKIKIERVDVPLRLEKRLAALVQDLAEHNRMTLSSCFEEILLHTNDGVTPHTKATVQYIQELKKKHGIDYDTHGSYRFTEE